MEPTGIASRIYTSRVSQLVSLARAAERAREIIRESKHQSDMPGDTVMTCKGYSRRLRVLHEGAVAALARLRDEKERLQRMGPDLSEFIRDLRVLPRSHVWITDTLAEGWPSDTCVCEVDAEGHGPEVSVAVVRDASSASASKTRVPEERVWSELKHVSAREPIRFQRRVSAPGKLEVNAGHFIDAFAKMEELTERHVKEQSEITERIDRKRSSGSGCVIQ
jgi:hypothetical protein